MDRKKTISLSADEIIGGVYEHLDKSLIGDDLPVTNLLGGIRLSPQTSRFPYANELINV